MAARSEVQVIARVISELNQLNREIAESRAAFEAMDGADAEWNLRVDTSQIREAEQQLKVLRAALENKKMRIGIDISEDEIRRMQRLIGSAQDRVIKIKAEVETMEAEQNLQALRGSILGISRMRAQAHADLDDSEFLTAVGRIETFGHSIDGRTWTAYFEANSDDLRREALESLREIRKVNNETATAKIRAEVGNTPNVINDIERRLTALSAMHADPRIALNDAQFKSELSRAEADLQKVRGMLVSARVDLDGETEMKAKIDALIADLDHLAAKHADAKVDVDIAAATAKAALLDKTIDGIDGKTVKVKTEVDTAKGVTGLNALQRAGRSVQGIGGSLANEMHVISAGVQLAGRVLIAFVVSSLAPIAGAAIIAAAGLTALAVAGGLVAAALAPAVISLAKHKTATNALESAQKSAETAQRSYADAVEQQEQTNISAARSVQQATKTYEDASQAVGKAQDDAARTVNDALKSQQDAQTQYARAVVESNRSVAEAARGVQQAQQGVADAVASAHQRQADAARSLARTEREAGRTQVEVAREIQDAWDQVVEARQAIADAISDAAKQGQQAWESYQQAVQNVADVEAQVAENVKSAHQAVADAAESAARTEAQAHRSVQSAIDSHKDALEALGRTQKDVAERTADAYKSYRDSIVALRDVQASGAERVRQATIALRRAEQQAAEAASRVVDARRAAARATQDLRQAQQALNRALRDEPRKQLEAELDVQELRIAGARAADDLTAAQNNLAIAQSYGYEPGVLQAQLTYQEALIAQQRNSIALARAEEALAATRSGGSEALQAAQDALASAYERQREAINAITDAELARQEATAGISEARRALAAEEQQRLRDIKDAQDAIKLAFEAYKDSQVQGQQEIADAQDRVKETSEAVALAQTEAAYSIKQANDQVASAAENARKAEVDGAKEIAAAQLQAKQALDQYHETQIAGQEQIATARKAAKEAEENYLRTVEEGNYRILTSQESVQDARREYNQAIIDGQKSVQAAQDALDEAGRQYVLAEEQRTQQIADAWDKVVTAAEAVDLAREEGALAVAAAIDDANEAADNLQFTQEQAMRDMAQAEQDVADATQALLDALGEVDKKAGEWGATLTQSQQDVLDKWKAFKDAAFGFVDDFGNYVPGALSPAQDILLRIIGDALDFATTYLPMIEPAATRTAEALERVWTRLKGLLQQPEELATLQTFLDAAPGIAESVGNAITDITLGVLNVIAQGVPDATEFFDWVEEKARLFREWTETAEANSTLAGLFKLAKEWLDKVWGVLVNVVNKIIDLANDPGTQAFAAAILDITNRIVENIPALGPWLGRIAEIMRAIGEILPDNVKNSVIQAWLLYVAFRALGGGVVMGWIFGLIGWIIKLVGWIAAAEAASWKLYTALGILAALAAIAILVYIYWDQDKFDEASKHARRQGDSAGVAFREGVIAALEDVPILGPAVKAFDDFVGRFAPGGEYDGVVGEWLLKQVGVDVDIPEGGLLGYFDRFIDKFAPGGEYDGAVPEWVLRQFGVDVQIPEGGFLGWIDQLITDLGPGGKYDGAFTEWLLRQLGIEIQLPEGGMLKWFNDLITKLGPGGEYDGILGRWIARQWEELKTRVSEMSWGDIGLAIVDGILLGMGIPTVEDIAAWAQGLINAFKEWWGISSPAETAKPLGSSIAEGILFGFWAYIDPLGYIQRWIDWWWGTTDTGAQGKDWGTSGSWGSSLLLQGFYAYTDPLGYIAQWLTWWWTQSDTGAQGQQWGYSGSWGSSGLLAGFFAYADPLGYIAQWLTWWWTESDSGAQLQEWAYSGSWGSAGLLQGFYAYADPVGYIVQWLTWWWGQSDTGAQEQDWKYSGSWGSSGMLQGFFDWADNNGLIPGWLSWWWDTSDKGAQGEDWEYSGSWGSSGMLDGFYAWADNNGLIPKWMSWWWDTSNTDAQNEGWGSIGNTSAGEILQGFAGYTDFGWIYTFFNSMWSNLQSKSGEYTWSNLGYDIVSGIVDGIWGEASSSLLGRAAQWLVAQFSGHIRRSGHGQSPMKLFNPHGLDIVRGLAQGVFKGRPHLARAAESVIDSVYRVSQSAYHSGAAMAAQLADGMESEIERVERVALRLADAMAPPDPTGPGTGAAILTAMPTRPGETAQTPGPGAVGLPGLTTSGAVPIVNVTMNGITFNFNITGAAAMSPEAVGNEVTRQLAAQLGPKIAQSITDAHGQTRRRTTRGGVGA